MRFPHKRGSQVQGEPTNSDSNSFCGRQLSLQNLSLQCLQHLHPTRRPAVGESRGGLESCGVGRHPLDPGQGEFESRLGSVSVFPWARVRGRVVKGEGVSPPPKLRRCAGPAQRGVYIEGRRRFVPRILHHAAMQVDPVRQVAWPTPHPTCPHAHTSRPIVPSTVFERTVKDVSSAPCAGAPPRAPGR